MTGTFGGVGRRSSSSVISRHSPVLPEPGSPTTTSRRGSSA
jgi:hypothetical protein